MKSIKDEFEAQMVIHLKSLTTLSDKESKEVARVAALTVFGGFTQGRELVEAKAKIKILQELLTSTRLTLNAILDDNRDWL